MRVISWLAVVGICSGALASELKEFFGTYECPQIIRTAPNLVQANRVDVTIAAAGARKARLSWSMPNAGAMSFETGEFGNGIAPGDLECRTFKPSPNAIPGVPAAQIPEITVTLSKTPAGKFLNFSVDKPGLGAVGTSCTKK